MAFNSVKYVIFLPIVVLIYFLIPIRKNKNNSNSYRNIFLIIASYYLYMCWVPQYAVLLFFSTALTYITSIILDRIDNKKYRKVCLITSIVLNLGILFIFKYYNFFIYNINSILINFGINWNFPTSSLLLPVGISFYTFQTIGYSIDVYRKDIKAEKNFINYTLFVSFFPKLVQGPIEKAKDIIPQFKEIHKFDYSSSVEGLRMILIGMFKKVVIADTVVIYVNAVFNNVEQYTGLTLLFAVFLFSIQIYCDFSGYSDIAVGSAKLLGFRLMENFHAPYFSQSIGEFWNRWHISLNNWFKDYVYIPLGGNRKGFRRKLINLFIIFLLSGIWHGASWTYIIWGALNGIYRVVQELIRKCCKPLEFNYKSLYKAKKVIKIVITFGLICFSWIFFRANTINDAVYIVQNMFTNISITNLINNCYTIVNESLVNVSTMRYFYFGIIIISILILFMIDIKSCKKSGNQKALATNVLVRINKAIRWGIYIIFTVTIIWMFIVQNGIFGQTGQFIYFQF